MTPKVQLAVHLSEDVVHRLRGAVHTLNDPEHSLRWIVERGIVAELQRLEEQFGEFPPRREPLPKGVRATPPEPEE